MAPLGLREQKDGGLPSISMTRLNRPPPNSSPGDPGVGETARLYTSWLSNSPLRPPESCQRGTCR
jgi:hypothetical protein